ncbi:MAG TPA: hypothetical protein VNU21_24640 [Usitatibacter sp.]|nr:hypothetical protein [Usitatibacter sp.]
MGREEDALRKKLDEVVGTRYDERGRFGLQWLRKSLPKWLAGAVLAVAAVATVWTVLDRHLRAAHARPGSERNPVMIQVLPAEK